MHPTEWSDSAYLPFWRPMTLCPRAAHHSPHLNADKSCAYTSTFWTLCDHRKKRAVTSILSRRQRWVSPGV